MKYAYLLVSHGSRDPRPQWAAEKLARSVAQKLAATRSRRESWARLPAIARSSGSTLLQLKEKTSLSTRDFPLVETATLELSAQPLHQQIQQFAQRARVRGCCEVQIVPLFLLPGVHVKEDIPAEVAIAQRELGRSVRLRQCHYLGSSDRISRLLAQQFDRLPATARILLSHGSRRPGGNAPIQTLATRLNALPAYWSVAPSLEEQIRTLVTAGQNQIAIQPYFLFTGGITEAIARRTQGLQLQFPNIQLFLGQPLGTTPELADLIIESIEQQ